MASRWLLLAGGACAAARRQCADFQGKEEARVLRAFGEPARAAAVCAWAGERRASAAAPSASCRKRALVSRVAAAACAFGERRASNADALASTRALVDVLSKDGDPKIRASKFLQFVSKMSKGELIFEDNKVRTW